MGFDAEFDRDGFVKGGGDRARKGALVVLVGFTALAMLFATLLQSGDPSPEPALVATPAPATTPAPNSLPCHLIVNRETGYCLDVPYGSQESKTPVEQFPVNGGGNQRWRLEPVPGGAVRIVNEHTGQCLDVPNGTTERVAVEQYTLHDGPNQGWRLEVADDGWYRIVNQLTGLCLQVEGESAEKRAKIEQAPLCDSPYQQWRTIAVR